VVLGVEAVAVALEAEVEGGVVGAASERAR